MRYKIMEELKKADTPSELMEEMSKKVRLVEVLKFHDLYWLTLATIFSLAFDAFAGSLWMGDDLLMLAVAGVMAVHAAQVWCLNRGSEFPSGEMLESKVSKYLSLLKKTDGETGMMAMISSSTLLLLLLVSSAIALLVGIFSGNIVVVAKAGAYLLAVALTAYDNGREIRKMITFDDRGAVVRP